MKEKLQERLKKIATAIKEAQQILNNLRVQIDKHTVEQIKLEGRYDECKEQIEELELEESNE